MVACWPRLRSVAVGLRLSSHRFVCGGIEGLGEHDLYCACPAKPFLRQIPQVLFCCRRKFGVDQGVIIGVAGTPPMTVLDDAGEGSAKACWALMRGAERTCLGPQAKAKSSSCLKNFCLSSRKNRTCIGPHPPARSSRGNPSDFKSDGWVLGSAITLRVLPHGVLDGLKQLIRRVPQRFSFNPNPPVLTLYSSTRASEAIQRGRTGAPRSLHALADQMVE